MNCTQRVWDSDPLWLFLLLATHFSSERQRGAIKFQFYWSATSSPSHKKEKWVEQWRTAASGKKNAFGNENRIYEHRKFLFLSIIWKTNVLWITWLQLNLIRVVCHTGQKQHNWIVSIIHLCIYSKMCEFFPPLCGTWDLLTTTSTGSTAIEGFRIFLFLNELLQY